MSTTPERILEQLSDAVRNRRAYKALSLSAVADRASVSVATVRRAELGDESISLGSYAKIVAALEMSFRPAHERTS